MKTCKKCQKEKPLSKFYNYKGKARGWCKRCDNINILIRQRIFKEKCVEYKGGKCETCGYKKSLAAMDFHHKDPSQKEFGISRVKTKIFDETIKKELDKCQLICANCHRELHEKENYNVLRDLWSWYQERRKKENLTKNINKICSCGNIKSTVKAATCYKCRNYKKNNRDINEVLNKLKENNFNWTKTAKVYNLSDNGLRKFVKSRGYDPKKIKELEDK